MKKKIKKKQIPAMIIPEVIVYEITSKNGLTMNEKERWIDYGNIFEYQSIGPEEQVMWNGGYEFTFYKEVH